MSEKPFTNRSAEQVNEIRRRFLEDYEQNKGELFFDLLVFFNFFKVFKIFKVFTVFKIFTVFKVFAIV